MSKTLVYSPRVEAFISTKTGIIDVSKDIAAGSVSRVTNRPSTASITLNNRNKRYTGVISRMDKIHIRFFKGSVEYPAFTGYITTVPVFDVYSTTTTIEAQCTLKQIMHTYWDPTDDRAIQRFIVKKQPLQQTRVTAGFATGDSGGIRSVGTEEQQRVIDFATNRTGKYRYSNGSGKYEPDTSGIADCSSFLHYVYKQTVGIDIGNYSVTQAQTGQHVISGTTLAELDESKLQPGDIIAYDWANRGRPSWDHVEMYIGNGQRIGMFAPSGPTIRGLHSSDWPMAKFTVRRHMSTGTPLSTVSSQTAAPVKGGRISSPFGARRGGGSHAGIDFAVPTGTPIYAWMSGTVQAAGTNVLQGRTGIGVMIQHSGWGSYYGHMSSVSVSAGQTVQAGQQIGLSGNTGNSTGPHLHFEINQGDWQKPINPAPYLDGTASPTQGGLRPEEAVRPFDPRHDYFETQAQEGLEGIRLRGFLKEVCGWSDDRIHISALPAKLLEMIRGFGITEGATDPEVAIQRIYAALMGDTFATNTQQSEAVLSASSGTSFTGTEGRGDRIITKVMYGYAKTVSDINYTATSDEVKYLNGTGAYGLGKVYFNGKEARSKDKTDQDAAMYNRIKSLIDRGTEKSVPALLRKLAEGDFVFDLNVDTISVNEFVSIASDHANKAPAPGNKPESERLMQGATPVFGNNESQIDLYLKGLREAESNNNYTARSPISTASGAYQYIDRTWNNEGGYPRAYLAPPEVQDARARRDAEEAYAKFGDWEKVAANHMYPAWADDKSKWDQVAAPGNPTMRAYIDKVLKYMNGLAPIGASYDQNSQGGVSIDTIDQSLYAFFKQVTYGSVVPSLASQMLTGEKALMNDESAMRFVETLAKGSMREFQSDPFGNFVAFYPDHFGLYTDNPETMVKIQDVELVDFSIRATDNIFTHVYTIDSSTYQDLYGLLDNVYSTLDRQVMTQGVVTFENVQLMQQILGMSERESKEFLQRFGGRPFTQNQPEITNKTFSKVHAIATFLHRWAGQYNTSVQFTFMPELYPGLRAAIADTGVGVYIDQVNHSFSYSGGFTTNAVVSSPQSIGGRSQIPGLVRSDD